MFALTGNSLLAAQALTGPVLLVVLIALGRILKRRAGVPLGFLYVLFCLSFAIWLPLEIFRPTFPARETLLQALRAANILLGTLFILALVRRSFWELWFERRHRSRAPKFLSQLFGLAAFIVAVLVVVGGIYGHPIEGVVFGSTIVVGIIGFAMQDLLGNIIAGIALELGKPFKTGDWLIVDDQRAEVIEVNWRSTKLRTNDDVYLDLPNKTIAGSKIVNLTYPTRQHAVRLTVRFDYQTPPNLIKDVMTRAASAVSGVLVTPAPKVFLLRFAESVVEYEIKFWMEDEARFNDIVDGVRTNVWYAAKRHGFRIPFPIQTVHLERPSRMPASPPPAAKAVALRQPFFQLLEPAQAETLLAGARLLRFGRGEKVISRGEPGESMFILLSGEAEVLIASGNHEVRVATLRPGDCCGEMSLLTGEPRNATIVAQSDCELWEIDKPVVAELLQANQPLVEKLGDLLAQRRLEAEGVLASETEKEQLLTKRSAYTQGFLQKLVSFFEL